MARTKQSPKKAVRKPGRPAKAKPGDNEVPQGFQDASASMEKLPAWNFDEAEQLDATVTKVHEVSITDKKGTRETRVAHVVTEDGEEFALWESAALKELFDNIGRNSIIRVIYTGTVELSGNREMRTFKAYFRDGKPF